MNTNKYILWKQTELKRTSWELRWTYLVKRVLNKLFADIRDFNHIEIDDKPVQKMLIDLHTSVGVAFAKDQFKKLKGINSEIEVKQEDDWYNELSILIRTRGAKKVTSIVNATREQAERIIQMALQESLDAGLGADETARAIRKALKTEGGIINQWRALRIARTEVMSASNEGAMLGAKEAGAELKYWIPTYDNRTRDTHLSVESQNPKMMHEAFLVGAYQMMQPGDPNAGPEEIINCRCAVAFGMV